MRPESRTSKSHPEPAYYGLNRIPRWVYHATPWAPLCGCNVVSPSPMFGLTRQQTRYVKCMRAAKLDLMSNGAYTHACFTTAMVVVNGMDVHTVVLNGMV